MTARRIGEILIAQGVLTEAAINRALGYQRVSGEHIKLGTILLNWDLLAEDGLLNALARFHRVEAAPWSVLSAAPVAVTRLIPAATAIRLGAFPFKATKTSIHVAFLEPSNLAVADEIASIANKRVVPAVALEIRLLQAHQKFYGRHVPLEYRAIVQKLERRTTRTKLPEWQKTVDFRLPDVTEAEKSVESAGPPSPGSGTPPMDLGRAPIEDFKTPRHGVPISVSRGLADQELLSEMHPTLEIPELPKLAPPQAADRLSDTNPLSASKRAAEQEAAERLSDTHPVGQVPSPPAAPPSGPPADDTLPKRMGAPFASLSSGAKPSSPEPPEAVEKIEFRPERPAAAGGRRAQPLGRRAADRDPDDTLPRGGAAHLTPRGSVADMWQPAAQENAPDEEVASRMWTPSASEIEASLGEARTRDEIGHVALETFLVDIPRVLLMGCGKSAVTGWQGRGEGVTPDLIAELRIPLSEESVFATIQGCGVPHFGPLDAGQWPAELAQRLGDRPPDCAVFPIRILDGIAAFLYADRLGEPMHYEDFAVIARASAATANALTRFLLRRNTTAPVL